jgi:hypothetical protein
MNTRIVIPPSPRPRHTLVTLDSHDSPANNSRRQIMRPIRLRAFDRGLTRTISVDSFLHLFQTRDAWKCFSGFEPGFPISIYVTHPTPDASPRATNSPPLFERTKRSAAAFSAASCGFSLSRLNHESRSRTPPVVILNGVKDLSFFSWICEWTQVAMQVAWVTEASYLRLGFLTFPV